MISYYELLKRIEKGDIPEKIKVHLTNTPRIYKADYDGSTFSHYFIYDGETDGNYHHYLAECFLESDMFEENIEIIEEKKIPEKIPSNYYLENDDIIKDTFYRKINEIIDYLQNKGE